MPNLPANSTSGVGLKFVSDDGFALVFEANGKMPRVAKVKEFTPAQSTILGWEVPDAQQAVSNCKPVACTSNVIRGRSTTS